MEITLSDLPEYLQGSRGVSEPQHLKPALDALQRRMVIDALNKKGNIADACIKLGARRKGNGQIEGHKGITPQGMLKLLKGLIEAELCELKATTQVTDDVLETLCERLGAEGEWLKKFVEKHFKEKCAIGNHESESEPITE
jgi:hypothetical protein